MTKTLTHAACIYLAVALISLGLQIPLRLDACLGTGGCLASFAEAPVWALIWPAYWLFSDALPTLVVQGAFFFSVPLVCAVVLLAAWSRWADRRSLEASRADAQP